MSKSKQLPSSLYRQLKEDNAKLQQVAELQAAQGCTAEVQSLRNAIRKRDEHIAAAEAQIKAHLQELGEYDLRYTTTARYNKSLYRKLQEVGVAKQKARSAFYWMSGLFAVYVLVDVLQCFLPTSG